MALNATAPPVDPRTAATCVADLLAALGSPSRVAIVRELAAAGPLDVGELAVRLGASVANVSHHLVRLRVARIVVSHRVGTRVVNEPRCPRSPSFLPARRACARDRAGRRAHGRRRSQLRPLVRPQVGPLLLPRRARSTPQGCRVQRVEINERAVDVNSA